MLVAAIVAAPIASSWHELTVRHVRCAEHGELTHVRAATVLAAGPARGFSSVGGEVAETADAHDHCSTGFIVRARFDVSVVRTLVRHTPPPAAVHEVVDAVARPGRVFVLASAPKTSPPSA